MLNKCSGNIHRINNSIKIIFIFMLVSIIFIFMMFRSTYDFYYTISNIEIGMSEKELNQKIQNIHYSNKSINNDGMEIVFGDIRGFLFGDFIKMNISMNHDRKIISITGDRYNIEDFSGTRIEFFKK